jgi:hypothetical protein
VKGEGWEVEIDPFSRLLTKVRDAISEEAEIMASLEGCSSAMVEASA